MTSWIDSWEHDISRNDFEPAYDSFYRQSLQPWELDYELRHNPEKDPVIRRVIPFTLSMKEWHRKDQGLPLRWCKNCSEETDSVFCDICGARTERLIS